MVAILLLLHLLLTAIIPRATHGEECRGPVSFNSSDFTIKGPCPSDTVLASIGSAIQYRCDYIDKTSTADQPYWHIPGLDGTPFLAGGGSEHGIKIMDGQNGQSRDSTINIPVKDQYLNNTLSIQCGLCTVPYGCYNSGNRLIENVTSTAVTLVVFGSPSNLHNQSPNDDPILSWSIPPVSTDYTDRVYFTYELNLTNIANSTQSISFTTNTTTHKIGPSDIPDSFDKCSNYSWSVRPIVGEVIGSIITAPDTIYFPSAPKVNLQSVNFNFTDCTSSQKASIEFEVNSCPSGGLPQSSITVIADRDYNIPSIDPIAVDGFGTYDVLSMFTVSDEFKYESNITVMIAVNNLYGNTITQYDLEDNINILTCTSEPVMTSTTISPTNTSSSTVPTDHPTPTTSSVLLSSANEDPSRSPSASIDPLDAFSSNNRVLYASIIVPVVFVLVVVVICIVFGFVVFYYKKKKSSMKVTSETEYSTIKNNDSSRSNKAFMGINSGGNNVFKYENVSISTCSTPMDISTPRFPLCSTTDSDQHSQEDQVPRNKEPAIGIDTTDGLYAVPMDVTNMRINANVHNEPNPINHLMTFPSKGGMDNPNYGKAMPGGSSRTEEAVYSMIGADSTQSNEEVVDMPGYSEVHIEPTWKKQRRSWHNTRVNSTPKHFNCSSSLPTTPLHASIKTSSQNPPVFLKLGDIEEAVPTPVTDTTTITTVTEGDDAVYDDIVYDKENIQEGNSEYVAVDEIKKRKNQVLRFSEQMIEMKELPPPTPTRDPEVTSPSSATPTSPSSTPPPIPPHPLSPSISSLTS